MQEIALGLSGRWERGDRMAIQGLGLDVGVNTCVDSSRNPRRPTRASMFSGGHEASCLLLMFRQSESNQTVVRQLVTSDSYLDRFILPYLSY